jgi:hypothetical protein
MFNNKNIILAAYCFGLLTIVATFALQVVITIVGTDHTNLNLAFAVSSVLMVITCILVAIDKVSGFTSKKLADWRD